ncbi:MAG: ATP-binding protein [Bacteroidota bacterium]|nr:ATP-binding protein [Bacteroidota bacterium]
MQKIEKNRIRKIVITGAESTGKTELAKGLAEHYNSVWVPEFARQYIETLNRPYNYHDVELIAKKQILSEEKIKEKAHDIIFYDTWLIITKIWFSEVYKKVPSWLNQHIEKSNIDLFLVCENDIAWIPDPVRENRDKRGFLQSLYIEEIEKLKRPWELIKGNGKLRFDNAIRAIKHQ